jgi:hypothetical protein
MMQDKSRDRHPSLPFSASDNRRAPWRKRSSAEQAPSEGAQDLKVKTGKSYDVMSGASGPSQKRKASVRASAASISFAPALDPRSERTRGVPDPHRVRASQARAIPHDPTRIDNSAQSPGRCYDPGCRNVSTFRRWADIVVERNMVPARPESVNIRSRALTWGGAVSLADVPAGYVDLRTSVHAPDQQQGRHQCNQCAFEHVHLPLLKKPRLMDFTSSARHRDLF